MSPAWEYAEFLVRQHNFAAAHGLASVEMFLVLFMARPPLRGLEVSP